MCQQVWRLKRRVDSPAEALRRGEGGVWISASLPVDWADVHQRAEALSGTHTPAGGHRLADILHVATALHLGSGEFLTFDSNQRRLAEAEGLVVPV
jgi:predicted nucleic acid-binding protein